MTVYTGLQHRANVVADVPIDECSDAPQPGEVLLGTDGRWLGNFDSQEVLFFNLNYPVGWTNGTWVEQPARAFIPDSDCDCTDCHGLTAGVRIEQQQPDKQIDCFAASIFDLYDYSIFPQKFNGTVHCETIFYPANFCMGFPVGACGNNSAFGSVANYGWPLTTFAFHNPSSRIRVVDDASGPDGCEEAPAMEIDFSGAGNEGAVFIGEGGGHNGDSPAQPGINNSDRSTTGWTVEDGTCWIEHFWVKAVEDNDGFVCTGYHISTRSGMYPFPFAQIFVAGASTLILDGTWQEFFRVWRADYVNPLAPALENCIYGIHTTAITNYPIDPSCPIHRPLFQRKGRVHIKKVQIYPCSTGVIVKRPSGRGH